LEKGVGWLKEDGVWASREITRAIGQKRQQPLKLKNVGEKNEGCTALLTKPKGEKSADKNPQLEGGHTVGDAA